MHDTLIVYPGELITALWYIAAMVVSYFIGQALAPKPKQPKPAVFAEFEFPQFDEGTPQYVIWGDCWSEDWMVLDYGKFRTKKIKSKKSKK